MIRSWPTVVLLLSASCVSAEKGPASPQAKPEPSSTRMEISGLNFGTLVRKEVRVTEKDGKTSVYGGALLADVLSGMGLPMGVHPKGRPPVEYVLVEGADRYRALFAKAELDPAFAESQVLLADRHDGQALAPGDGPWRLVVPSDRIRSRWVKQVKAIEVSSPR